MRGANLVTGVVALGIAGFFIWGASELPMGRPGAPEAGFVPFWVAVSLAVVSVALIATSLPRGPREPIEWPRGPALWMVLHISAALVGYVLVAELLGYACSTFLFMLAVGSAWKRYSWLILGVWAAGFSFALFVTFNLLLQIPLPRSVFGLP